MATILHTRMCIYGSCRTFGGRRLEGLVLVAYLRFGVIGFSSSRYTHTTTRLTSSIGRFMDTPGICIVYGVWLSN